MRCWLAVVCLVVVAGAVARGELSFLTPEQRTAHVQFPHFAPPPSPTVYGPVFTLSQGPEGLLCTSNFTTQGFVYGSNVGCFGGHQRFVKEWTGRAAGLLLDSAAEYPDRNALMWWSGVPVAPEEWIPVFYINAFSNRERTSRTLPGWFNEGKNVTFTLSPPPFNRYVREFYFEPSFYGFIIHGGIVTSLTVFGVALVKFVQSYALSKSLLNLPCMLCISSLWVCGITFIFGRFALEIWHAGDTPVRQFFSPMALHGWLFALVVSVFFMAEISLLTANPTGEFLSRFRIPVFILMGLFSTLILLLSILTAAGVGSIAFIGSIAGGIASVIWAILNVVLIISLRRMLSGTLAEETRQRVVRAAVLIFIGSGAVLLYIIVAVLTTIVTDTSGIITIVVSFNTYFMVSLSCLAFLLMIKPRDVKDIELSKSATSSTSGSFSSSSSGSGSSSSSAAGGDDEVIEL